MSGRNMLEICAADIDSVVAAATGGADRIELCSGLAEGGVTPSIGLIRQAVKIPGIRIHVLIRPRAGNFTYSEPDIKAMIHDIRQVAEAGAHGVVTGALDSKGNVDIETCRRLINAAGDMSVTFHRAFDMCRDPYQSLEQIISLGFHRILTSGGSPKALDGCDELARLVSQADGRITILAGSGVSPDNAAMIMSRTGVTELHASAGMPIPSALCYTSSAGIPSEEYARRTSSVDIVKKLSAIVHNHK